MAVASFEWMFLRLLCLSPLSLANPRRRPHPCPTLDSMVLDDELILALPMNMANCCCVGRSIGWQWWPEGEGNMRPSMLSQHRIHRQIVGKMMMMVVDEWKQFRRHWPKIWFVLMLVWKRFEDLKIIILLNKLIMADQFCHKWFVALFLVDIRVPQSQDHKHSCNYFEVEHIFGLDRSWHFCKFRTVLVGIYWLIFEL